MKEYAEQFDRAIRYAAAHETPDSPLINEPLGFDVPDTDIHAGLPRFAAADYLRELGRDNEADTVQLHSGPLLLDGGKVKKGAYTTKPAYDRYNAVLQHLQDFYPDWEPQHEIEAKYEADSEYPIPDDHERIHYLDDTGEPQIAEDVHARDFGPELAHILRAEHASQHGDGEYDDTLDLLLKRLQRSPHIEPAE